MSGAGDAFDLPRVREHLLALQDAICAALEEREPRARFRREEIATASGGLARPRVLEDGEVLERAAVNFSHTLGERLPEPATARRPELAGRAYEAASVSLIVHPRNPYAPTTHANFRAFVARAPGTADVWWFGGGFDLTPIYGFVEDAVHWHRVARDACAPFGAELYPRFKAECDRYFFLPHRGEARGVGGLFFDDFAEGGFTRAFAFWRAVSERFLPAYLPILDRRKDAPHGPRERAFQLHRRGRYVEFNLLHDRGTRFGLLSGGRTESILASLPPVATWRSDFPIEPGSPEERLAKEFLVPRDWASAAG